MLSIGLVGCGGAPYAIAPVSGKVTKNGQPYPGVVVLFEPIGGEGNLNPGPTSGGKTGPDGTFELILHDEVKTMGAVVGKHRVRIWTDMKSTDDQNNWTEKIPQRYNQDTQETFTVPSEGSTEANFDIKM